MIGLFEKGKLRFESERYDKANEALEKAKSPAPREAGIHFLLGLVYAATHEDVGKVMCAFDAARELAKDGKEAAAVKADIDALRV